MIIENDTLIKPGTVIDNKWIIIEMIGKGAMGVVYRAHQINLNRDVAIKTLSEEMLKELEDDPEEMAIALKRFQREVQTMAQVRHSNILNIFDYSVQTDPENGQERRSGTVEYIVMEYIPGNTLRFTMSEDGLDDIPELYADWIESYFLPVLDGVEAMHRHNIFHRDLKPENIFMDGEIPKIADFGLARSYRLKAVSNSMEMKGTLTYMAPEQFSNFRKADQTADIYALGKLLFEAIDGKLDQKTLPMKMVSLTHYKNIDIPFLKAMDAIIQKATDEEKNNRFQSVAELRADLVKALALNKVTPADQDASSLKKVPFVHKHSKGIWIGIVLTLMLVVGMAGWHLTDNVKDTDGLKPLGETTDIHDPEIEITDNIKDLKEFLIARDGSKMILTGTIDRPDKDEVITAIKTPLFYIDENRINNYLFVDFLNQIKESIIIENGIVKHNDVIVFYLGPGTQEEDQIIYQHERFHLKNPEVAGRPVTRVSYHGALKYAQYYGRTLLTKDEWMFSYSYHQNRYLKTAPPIKETEPEPRPAMMNPAPEKQPETKEIQVLDGMGLKIREWVRIESTNDPEKTTDIHLFSGIMDSKMMKTGSDPVLRQQWEGFSDVGFRTKIQIQ